MVAHPPRCAEAPRMPVWPARARRQVQCVPMFAMPAGIEVQGDEYDAGRCNAFTSSGGRQALHQLQPLAWEATPRRHAGYCRGRLGRSARGVHRGAMAPELARRTLGLWPVAAVDGVTGRRHRRALTPSSTRASTPHDLSPSNRAAASGIAFFPEHYSGAPCTLSSCTVRSMRSGTNPRISSRASSSR